ncbi:Ankyrin repeat family protein [Arabidopsis thaliana]|uniref:Ankyrin repeat family protein n=1 Tax=Arabidopsis thaliana TaxID=3702 RepID=F4JG88_ARATH|nr:Ankyrin repeat family protein [Arabidopsis thaliana]AEE82328.1 Ankyrin repeat family protein [Arabidopsis thaliana]|eukprot:NP_001190669.1 Ankyrin repeat family protein [Arabidopsis thaliana]
MEENEIPVLDQVTFQGNTILHLAAIYGHDHLVRRILAYELNILRNWKRGLNCNFVPSFSHYQTLLVRRNYKGDLALHVAAAAGHKLIVGLLIDCLRQLPQDITMVIGSEQMVIGNIFRVSNNDGNTALHLSLKGNHVSVSLQLVREDRSTCFLLDKEDVSPLYMAAEAGYVSLVEHMLRGLDASFVGKSVLCAAVKSQNLDILTAVLESDSDLVESRDEDGRTPLATAASIGYDIGVQHMLTRFASSTQVAYIKNEDGSFPIHSACSARCTSALKVILKHHPDTIEMLNSQGQNVLHVAAKSGNARAVGYLLRKSDVKRLINEQDIEGNTPLHLASSNSHPKVWLIWMALVAAGTTRAPRVHLRADIPGLTTDEDLILKIHKDRVNTLLVVATLVATMAFAAGLSVPLGYNSTEFKSNVKHSYEESAFHAFVICNSIAVYTAVISTVALIGTQLADLKCMLTTFKFIVPLLGFSIIAMSLAFVAGLYLVLGHHYWLAIFVLASGGFYLMALLLLIIPYASPYTFTLSRSLNSLVQNMSKEDVDSVNQLVPAPTEELAKRTGSAMLKAFELRERYYCHDRGIHRQYVTYKKELESSLIKAIQVNRCIQGNIGVTSMMVPRKHTHNFRVPVLVARQQNNSGLTALDIAELNPNPTTSFERNRLRVWLCVFSCFGISYRQLGATVQFFICEKT